ncbi:unnamed protein product [Schistosoma margrebowiei]|uniref:Interleukin-4 inducing immunoglobulin-binding domain-containing protein n=1 Tax=Schistosoma margrebowiei TaxID=48269 RepID=A0AA84ZCE0_9TREM|nr:unnamed protein product [Schistosoma margrebowiei]
MLVNLFFLVTIISYAAVYAVASNPTTTEMNSDVSASNKSSSLLNWRNTISRCVRLYMEPNQLGGWFDICDSNELLSSTFVWRTRSICTPGNTNSFKKTYWLIYERSHFAGPYILLGHSKCIDDINQYKLLATMSILICVEKLQTKWDVFVSCQYPKRPWREFFPVNWHSDYEVISKSGTESADEAEASSLEEIQSLIDLQENCVNNK